MKLISDFLKGAVIGIANIIPGLSGGTMALIMGIYERLTDAIGNFLIDKDKRKGYILFLITIVIVHHNHFLLNRTDSQDTSLTSIEDGSELLNAKGSQVGNREGAAGYV